MFSRPSRLFSFLTFALALSCAGSARASDELYFYSGGQRNPLPLSTKWLAVQLDSDAAQSAVRNKVLGSGALDKSRGARRLARFGITELPIAANTNATKRTSLRASLQTIKGVRRVLRAFGNGKNPVVETDEFVVRFKAPTDVEAAAEILGRRGAAIVEKLGSYAPNGYLARVVRPDVSALEVSNALYESGMTVFAHPNFIWPKQRRFVPNDTLFANQWHLRNTGQNGGTAGADIKAEGAWDISVGANITIAILDDGVELTHEDLAGRFVPGYDFVDGDSDPSPAVDQPNNPYFIPDDHGTACAGVAAASSNNAKGVAGIAAGSKIMPIRIVGDSTVADEAAAFRFAADGPDGPGGAPGADVLSNSWGPEDGLGSVQPIPSVVSTAIDYAATNGRGGKGCVILFASGNGNESSDNDGYASHPKVISVAASTNRAQRAYYSDYGSTVDINAPSDGGTLAITTTDRTGNAGFNYGGNYSSNFGGTSSACPLAAGVAALVLSQNPGLTRAQVQTILQNTADKIDNPTTGSTYNATTGHSIYYGYGRVNALAAIRSASNFSVSGRITRAGAGLSGVRVSSTTGAFAFSDSGGYYTIANAAGRNRVVITPTLAGTTFAPASQALTLSANATNINFASDSYSVQLTSPANNAALTRTANFVARTSNDAATTRVEFEGRPMPFSLSTPVNAPIPDNSTTGVTSRIANDRPGRAAAVSVRVNLSHSFVGDLVLTVVSPDGKRYIISNRAGGAATSFPNLFVLLIGTNFPLAGGEWQLLVQDASGGNTGTLQNWTLNVDTQWGVIAQDTDGPISGNWTATSDFRPLPRGSYLLRAAGVSGGTRYLSAVNTVSVTPDLYIAGRITNSAGGGVQGVVVSRSGTTATVTTGPLGYYGFSGVARGTYTVTPQLNGRTFSPASKQVVISTGDVVGVDFLAPGSAARIAPATTKSTSSVALSSVSARSDGTLHLVFTGALATSLSDASRFTVSANDANREVVGVQTPSATEIILTTDELKVGARVSVSFVLQDAQGRAVLGTASAVVR